jgi:hypothetical protein
MVGGLLIASPEWITLFPSGDYLLAKRSMVGQKQSS